MGFSMATRGSYVQNAVSQFARSAAIAAILAMTVCIFTPLVLYTGNYPEFTASFIDVLGVCLPYVLPLVAVFAFLGALMPAGGFQRYLGVLAALAVLTWVQGNILVWDYGPLDGRSIPWAEYGWRGALDLTIWILVLVFTYAHSRFRGFVVQAAPVTLLIQVLMAAVTAAPRADEILFRHDAESNASGREAIVRFSPERNVLHIVMDGFQSDIFAEIVNDPENSAFKDKLRGFTYFTDNMGIFPYTQMTVPAMLSGEVYHNHVPAQGFIESALQGDTVLSVAAEKGYEVDIAAAVPLKNVYSLAKHAHSYGITSYSHATAEDYAVVDAARLIDLALFRVVPHFAKALVHRDQLWVFQTGGRTSDYLQMQYFADLAFLRQLRREMTADREKPVYKMLHLMLSHRPTVGNENCEFDGTNPTSRHAVLMQARCGLMHVLNVLERMQELGIYDNSLIVLLADHGAWVPAEGVQGSREEGQEVGAATIGMAIPVLAIKPPGDSGTFRTSRAPTSVVDIPATISDILDLDGNFDGTPAFGNAAGGARERRHLVYAYGENPDHEGYYFPMREYVVNGSPFNAAAWQATRLFRPEGNVEAL
jgi:hypothetical protein